MESRFSLRDYQRFGIQLLQENGFQVEVWDFTPLLNCKLFQGYVPPDLFDYNGLSLISSKQEMHDKLSRLSKGDFVINLVSYNFENLSVYRALSKSDARYAVFYGNALPVYLQKKKGLCLLRELIGRITGLRQIESWKRLLIELPLNFLGVKPADLILAGGEKCFSYHFPVNKHTEVLYIHTLDYDLYLKEKNNNAAERAIAVFLDEFIPFHPERLMVGVKNFVDPDKYYSSLNSFLNMVEKETGLEVVIAAHPRSNYEDLPDYFNGRKCIKGKTINLIKDCKLVIAHCSTALNFANLFYKPVIFMTYSELDNVRKDRNNYIKEFARWFGKGPISIDRDFNGLSIDWRKELSVSKQHYNEYKRAYIKTQGSEDLVSWQIVANRLKRIS